jgi:cupin superfamily acireductone dioxygenase involved in methionine salvage
MLEVLVGAVNSDTATLSTRTGIKFPKHLTDEVCEYLIVGDGYFDFKGREGLIKTIRKCVPDTHYLIGIVKADKYKEALERLSALRNYAAHDSMRSKEAARRAAGQAKIMSAGDWLCTQGRLADLIESCRAMAREIKEQAPF